MPIDSIEPIESFSAPGLQPYATMRRQEAHRREGIFVAEGAKCVRRLLESDLGVVSVLLPAPWLERLRPLIDRRPEGVRVYTAEKRLLERLAGYPMYQGLLAVGKVPKLPSVGELLEEARPPRLLAALEGLSNAENVGAVVRNCIALNADAVIVGETSSSPYIRRAVRSSMASVFHARIVEPPSLRQALVQLRAAGVCCVAAHPRPGAVSLAERDLTGDCCLVFGSEGHGISEEILRVCDVAAAIPMATGIDSLNVSSAAAVFLFEAARQRAAFAGGRRRGAVFRVPGDAPIGETGGS